IGSLTRQNLTPTHLFEKIKGHVQKSPTLFALFPLTLFPERTTGARFQFHLSYCQSSVCFRNWPHSLY
ncbi:MAG: hypothetical protein KA401_04245, partial [Anaerolineae bacterium]|nr:hypothetical protein [Anaerolineae bacterium]